MRIQTDDISCGAFAIHNSLKVYGKNVSIKRIKKIAATDEISGTDEVGIVNALAKLGFVGHSFNYNKLKTSWLELKSYLNRGCPVILCTDNYNHWVVAIGLILDKVIIYDSDNKLINIKENGVTVFNRRQLSKKWRSKSGGFFGIGVDKTR